MSRPIALWSAVLGLVLGLSVATDAAGQPSLPDTIPSPPNTIQQDTVHLAPDGTVEIDDTHTGTITVTTWDRDRVAYTIAPVSTDDSTLASTVSVSHTDQELSIDQDGASWSIRIPGLLRISPSGGKERAGHYRVTMPTTATLEIDDFASTIEVSDVRADLEIATQQGSVVVDSAGGTLDLSTHTGRIEATGVRGGIALETHAGEASVVFEDFSTSSVVETHSGTLRFFLPAEAGFVLQTDLDSTDLTIDEAFGSPSTGDEGRTFNGGGPTLTLDALYEAVTIRPLEAHEASRQR